MCLPVQAHRVLPLLRVQPDRRLRREQTPRVRALPQEARERPVQSGRRAVRDRPEVPVKLVCRVLRAVTGPPGQQALQALREVRAEAGQPHPSAVPEPDPDPDPVPVPLRDREREREYSNRLILRELLFRQPVLNTSV